MSQRATVPGRAHHGVADEERERFVTQREAADLAGCSKDTIIRARHAGRFPHASLDGHAWTVPIDDLVAAGLCDEAAKDRVVPRASRVNGGPKPASMELARAQARIAALEDLVGRQDDELAFLRQLTVDTLGRRAAS